jgi:predicted nuclease with TOPRIM domain
LVLSGPVFGQNESEIKQLMLEELSFLRRVLLSVNEDLKTTKNSLSELSKRNQEDLKSTEKEIESLEKEKLQVEERLSRLQKDYNLLNDSKDLSDSLNDGYELEIEILEGQVRLWRGVAIGAGAVAVATVVYILVR